MWFRSVWACVQLFHRWGWLTGAVVWVKHKNVGLEVAWLLPVRRDHTAWNIPVGHCSECNISCPSPVLKASLSSLPCPYQAHQKKKLKKKSSKELFQSSPLVVASTAFLQRLREGQGFRKPALVSMCSFCFVQSFFGEGWGEPWAGFVWVF